MTDWEARLRSLRDEALEAIEGADSVSEYERSRIRRIWKRQTGEADLADLRLTVQIPGDEQADAYAISRVGAQLQNATALIAKSRRMETDNFRLEKGDRQRALLVQESQIGNTLTFRLPSPEKGLFGTDSDSPTAVALRDLVSVLPSSEEDDTAVDQILGSPDSTRAAVHRIAKAAVATHGLNMQLQLPGMDDVNSVLEFSRAKELSEELGLKKAHTTHDVFRGKMDGLRNSRRLFYLIREGNHEVSGVVEPEQLAKVLDAVGKDVVIRVTGTQYRSKSGSKTPIKYRLDSLEIEQTLPGFES